MDTGVLREKNLGKEQAIRRRSSLKGQRGDVKEEGNFSYFFVGRSEPVPEVASLSV